jgi:hypothetical protein
MGVRVQVVDGYIEIRVKPSYVYDIEIDQIVHDQKTGRLNWLNHLRQKRWFTKSLEAEFLDVAKTAGLENLQKSS